MIPPTDEWLRMRPAGVAIERVSAGGRSPGSRRLPAIDIGLMTAWPGELPLTRRCCYLIWRQ